MKADNLVNDTDKISLAHNAWLKYLDHIDRAFKLNGVSSFRNDREEALTHAAFAWGYGIGKDWIEL